MGVRARRVAVVTVALTAGIVAALVAIVWYVVAEERRAGRVVAALLTERTGLPITVERANVAPSHVRLRGVHVAAAPGLPLEVRVRELTVSGGMVSLVAPTGRRITVVAVSPSVIVPSSATAPRGTAPSSEAFEAVRRTLRTLVDSPALLSFHLDDGRLEIGGHQYGLEMTVETAASGFTLTTVVSASQPSALRVDAHAVATGNSGLRLGLNVTAKPRQLAPLWPMAVPAPTLLVVGGDVSLDRDGGEMTNGRLTLGEGATPVVVEFVARYEPTQGALVLPRYTLQSDRDLRLNGDGELRAGTDGMRARATARGVVDSSPVDGSATWDLARDGHFSGALTMGAIDSARLARRLGVAPPPTVVTARKVAGRFSGASRGERPRVSVDMTVDAVTVPLWPGVVTDATVAAVFALRTGRSRDVTLESSTLAVTRGGRSLGVVTAASRAPGPWPIALVARVDDLAALESVVRSAALSGSARLTGELSGLDPPTFRGVLTADVRSARVPLGAPTTLDGAMATIPVAVGVAPDSKPGSISAVRLAALGLAVEHLTSTAWLTDGQLLLPDIQYVHYGGEGAGWLEARLDDRPALLRLRAEGREVDLERLSREAGANVARITGRARYVANAQYTRAGGLAISARLDSERDGGEVSIDAIQRLLDSAALQADNNAVLQQTLQNLRTFPYETLESVLRYAGGAGRIDLSLRGKKRLGIFPAPVEAINIQNVPLTVLARAFAKEKTP